MVSKQTKNLSDWVNEYAEGLLSWALHKVSDPELAKDLVQDTFLAASEKLDTFRGDSSPKTWLYSILNFKIIDHYRAKVKQSVKMDNPSFSGFFTRDGEWQQQKRPKAWHEEENHLLDDPEFQAILKSCLDALPEKWSACIKLKYLYKKSGDEVCQELEITPANFWQMVHRAKLNLRECIEKNWFND